MHHANTSSRQITRRKCLQLAACGAVAPYVIPRGVLAEPGRPGANDRIAIGGIGVGRQGSVIVANAAGRSDVRLVAVADVNLPRARNFAKPYEVESYRDYRRLLDRTDIDATMTATPEHWRALICIHACQAGKDIYAEKPISLTIGEGRRIVEAVRKHNRVFQTGSHQRSMAANRLGCELIRNGRIGKVQKVIACNYPSPWQCGLPSQPVPEGLDWDMWCGPTDVVPYHIDLYTSRAKPGWISFQPYSGGEMTGWGSHGLDQVQWALGMDAGGPIEVWTEGDKFAPPSYTMAESRKRGEDICSSPKVFFRYPGDIVMELGDGPAGGAIFVGDKGTITIDREKCTSNPAEIVQEPIKGSEIRLIKSDDHIQNWLECIRSREKPICDVEVGHRSATVCHLGNIARWTGERLHWDPVVERFSNSAGANKMLTRPMRAPWVV